MGNVYKKVSSHGSVNIPAAMRRDLGLQARDPIEVSTSTEGDIILKPYLPRCMYCGTQDNVHKVFTRHVCFTCARKVYEILREGGNDSERSETDDKRTACE